MSEKRRRWIRGQVHELLDTVGAPLPKGVGKDAITAVQIFYINKGDVHSITLPCAVPIGEKK